MAIGAIHLAWLRRLADLGCFRGMGSVIDVGPQDIQLERRHLHSAAHGMLPARRVDSLLDAMYANGEASRDAQKSFYALFGLGPYASADLQDDRATYRVDLNVPADEVPEFDVVTNFGTTEHVFNIGQAFKSIHNMTRPGGVSLHCVPCFGFVNHGFYTINPNLFVEMARANCYEIVDFTYMDNAFVRNMQLGSAGVGTFDLAALPIQLEDMRDTQFFMTKVVDLFHRNLLAPETQRAIAALDPATRGLEGHEYPGRKYHMCFVFDLVFFAMRRPKRRADFAMPIQNPTGVAPVEQVVGGPDGHTTPSMARREPPSRGLLSRLGRLVAGR